MAFKMKGFPMHEPGHKGKRTRLDDKLEEDDKRRDVWNPKKQARLEKKAAKKRAKADDALTASEESFKEIGKFKGTGKAYRTERRAQRAEAKARAEAGKRGRDTNTPKDEDSKGIKSIKGAGRKGIFGQDKKALSRGKNK